MRRCALYAVTHIATARVYVGISVKPRHRWNQHWHDCQREPEGYFHRALAKYGRDAFRWQVVHWFDSPEEAKSAERAFIAAGVTHFNLNEGGDGNFGYSPSVETRARMAAAKLGRLNDAVRKSNARRLAAGSLGFQKKTHCFAGHELTPENRYANSGGKCRICCKARAARSKARRRLTHP